MIGFQPKIAGSNTYVKEISLEPSTKNTVKNENLQQILQSSLVIATATLTKDILTWFPIHNRITYMVAFLFCDAIL